MIIEAILLAGAFFTSYAGVAIFRLWSAKRAVFDIPNERSSHNEPVPRGGGLVIVAVCLACYIYVSMIYPGTFSWSYFAGSVSVAAVSWLDDLYSIAFPTRLIVHMIAAGLAVYELGPWAEMYIPFISARLELGILGPAITSLWIVWVINAYNFMDGIDGLAGLQAVLAGAGWLLFGYILGLPSLLLYSGVIIVSSFGFLLHNWHPARVFLGDVGSAFLGFTFACMPLLVQKIVGNELTFLPVAAVMFIWLFMFDTLLTLVRRLVRGKKVWHPHREHIYQRLVISGLPHDLVAVLYGVLSSIIVLTVVLALNYSGILEPLLLAVIGVLTATLIVLAFARKALV